MYICGGEQWGHRAYILGSSNCEAIFEPFECDLNSLLVAGDFVELEETIEAFQ